MRVSLITSKIILNYETGYEVQFLRQNSNAHKYHDRWALNPDELDS